MKFNFATDEETVAILEIAGDFLMQYFNHSQAEAEHLLNVFYAQNRDRVDDNFYHHESSFRIAAMTHYFVYLQHEEQGFIEWLKREGFWETPRAALDYFNSKYFNR